MDTMIDNRMATCDGTTHTLATPMTKEVIMDAMRSSARVNRTPRHVSRTGRDGSIPVVNCIAVRSPRANSPVLIGNTTVSSDCRISGILQVGNKQQYTFPDKLRNAQKLDTAVDIKLPNDWDYA